MMSATTIYVIYNSEYIPVKVSYLRPTVEEVGKGNHVCEFTVMDSEYEHKFNKVECTVDIKYNQENAWYPKGSLFLIYDGLDIIGSEQGYSHKHAKSIVKNLKLAYPNKNYKIELKAEQK